jgi:hypothetical protein
MTLTNIESVAAIEVMGGARKGGKVQFGNRNAMIIYEVGRHFCAKAAQRLGMGHITDFPRPLFGRVLINED